MKRNRVFRDKRSWKETLKVLSLPQFTFVLKGIRRGIEKEALRVTADARLAQTGHPVSLGSALTHDHITTDYAEALMEFITPVGTDAEETLGILADIQHHVYHSLGEELLWPVSMPCHVEKEDDIELAQYGDSNVGKMKTLYRLGLKNRYGSMMQAIAGVHYNFSMPDSFWPIWQKLRGDHQPLQDFISENYLGLTRNFLRIGWLIPYLFGASPAVSSSFLENTRKKFNLDTLDQDTQYMVNATSLRMSDLGYNTTEQDTLAVSYNNLTEFVSGLRRSVKQANAEFAKIGVKREGEYQQLNSNTLQDESELYAPIRPKQTVKSGEKLSDALQDRGIEYIEVRSLDVNPYSETGIDLEQTRFLDVFLLYCLLSDSPDLSMAQQASAQQNLNKVATCGREHSLFLMDDYGIKSMAAWAEEVFADLVPIARLLDDAYQSDSFESALNSQLQKLENPELTPSARMLKDMREQGLGVNELAMSLAKSHRHTLLDNGYRQMSAEEFLQEATTSWLKQKELEETDSLSFDDFLRVTLDGSLTRPLAVERGERNHCFWPPQQDQSLSSCTG
jgi:glutamate--cysteine ligase